MHQYNWWIKPHLDAAKRISDVAAAADHDKIAVERTSIIWRELVLARTFGSTYVNEAGARVEARNQMGRAMPEMAVTRKSL